MGFKNTFNVEAGKIVDLDEWRNNLKALRKANLTTKEKIRLKAEGLLSLPQRAGISLHMLFSKKAREGVYRDRTDQAVYISSAFAERYVDKLYRVTRDKEMAAKLTAFAQQAFEQCADHRENRAVKVLKGDSVARDAWKQFYN
jgi:hypothetical protein